MEPPAINAIQLRARFLLLLVLASAAVAVHLHFGTRSLSQIYARLKVAEQRLADEIFEHHGVHTTAAKQVGTFYSVRARDEAELFPELAGAHVDEDPPTMLIYERLEGHIEGLDAGLLTGWACIPGLVYDTQLQALVYVNGRLADRAAVTRAVPHPSVHKLCEVNYHHPSATSELRLGFQLELPPLPPGSHEVRVFVQKDTDASSKQELPHSPLQVIEVADHTEMGKALESERATARMMMDQMQARCSMQTRMHDSHLRQPDMASSLPSEIPSTSNEPALAVIGVNSGVNSRQRRSKLRRTWIRSANARKQMYIDTQVIIYFVIGYSTGNDSRAEEADILLEMQLYNDIIRVNTADSHNNLTMKTLQLFTLLYQTWQAEYYLKVDDDVPINLQALTNYLRSMRGKDNLYMGCMKSGAVISNSSLRYHEPQHWVFGENTTFNSSANYPRHAAGQIYGLSAPLVGYLVQNAHMLHRFANEDVSMGVWLLGLEVRHVDDLRFCCTGPDRCKDQRNETSTCFSYYEYECAGICEPLERLEGIYWGCLSDPLNNGANGWWKLD